MSIGVAAALLVIVTGCSSEPPIVTYEVPTKMPAALRQEDTRMVAAILPQPDQAWFFKLMGPQTAVDRVAETFQEFVQQVEFVEGVPVIGDLPEGWRRGKDRAMRFASIDIETPEKQLDLSISQLARSSDWDELIAMNVNRWRGQVGLDDSDERWAGAEALPRPEQESSATEPAIWVDVTGRPSSDAPMMPGMATSRGSAAPFAEAAAGGGSDEAADPHAGLPREAQDAVAQAKARAAAASENEEMTSQSADPRLQYDAPEHWREGRMSAMRMAAFDVGPEEAAAELTVITAGGDLRGNVARWIGQVLGSTPPDEVVDQVLAEAETLTVSDREAQRFVLVPESLGGDESASAIDATIVPLDDGFSLFVKMTGPATTVRQQDEAMRTFLQSLRFQR